MEQTIYSNLALCGATYKEPIISSSAVYKIMKQLLLNINSQIVPLICSESFVQAAHRLFDFITGSTC